MTINKSAFLTVLLIAAIIVLLGLLVASTYFHFNPVALFDHAFYRPLATGYGGY